NTIFTLWPYDRRRSNYANGWFLVAVTVSSLLPTEQKQRNSVVSRRAVVLQRRLNTERVFRFIVFLFGREHEKNVVLLSGSFSVFHVYRRFTISLRSIRSWFYFWLCKRSLGRCR